MNTLAFTIAFAAAGLALSACGRPEEGTGAPRLATQAIAARVNGNEISLQQVAHVVEQGGIAAPQQPTPAQALERLIDQELLVETAVAAKLDREPKVLQAIAAERRRILGLAYLERTVPPAPQRTPEEVRRFFLDNPALFQRRRIYQVQELLAAVPDDKKEQLKAEIAGAATLDDIAKWFKAQDLPFRTVTSVRPAEHIPIEILLRVAEMEKAQIAMFMAPDKVSVLALIHAEDAPLSETQAAPVIEQLLANRWRVELAIGEIRRLREKARIEYLGQFDNAAAGRLLTSSAADSIQNHPAARR